MRTFVVRGDEDGPDERPLIVAFHGSMQDGASFRSFTGGVLDGLADRGSAVVAYPDGYRGHWNDDRRENYFAARRRRLDDVAFFRALVADVTAHFRVGRVIVVGYSNGGEMVLTLLHRTPELIAGAVSIAATLPAPGNFLSPQGAPAPHAVPVVMVHGTRDPIVPYTGGPMPWYARWLFRVSGEALSAPDTARYLARRNGIDAAPHTVAVPRPEGTTGRTTLARTTYGTSEQVVLHTVVGGGHTVPGARPAPAFLGATSDQLSLADVVGSLIAAQ